MSLKPYHTQRCAPSVEEIEAAILSARYPGLGVVVPGSAAAAVAALYASQPTVREAKAEQCDSCGCNLRYPTAIHILDCGVKTHSTAGDAPVNPAEWPKTMEQLNAVWHEGHKAGYEQAIREMQSATAEEAKSPYDITAQQHNINVARRQPGGL